MRMLLHWIPRILAIAFALFLGLFALDIFSENYTVVQTAIALSMHLIPTFLLLIAVVIAWRWRVTGGLLFLLLGAVSVLAFNTYREPITFFIVSMTPFIVGLLFLWDGFAMPHQPTRAGQH